MKIRKTTLADLPRVMEIYALAREFMAANGNPTQWAERNWPPEDLIRSDIAAGDSYVCEHEDRIIAVFYFVEGPDIEPTYRVIEDGDWADDSPYGVVHRIATDGTVRGTGAFCLDWAFEHCGHLRIDTHGDNLPMQRLVEKVGFVRRGTIHVVEDPYPRYAYEKS